MNGLNQLIRIYSLITYTVIHTVQLAHLLMFLSI